jgi:hypothetical protein
VAGDYFRAMKIPLVSGRVFDRRETAESPPVIMINDAFARKFFPGRDAIGQHVLLDADEEPTRCEVVGVVANSRHDSLHLPAEPEFYLPIQQNANARLDLVIRTTASKLAGLDAAVKEPCNRSTRISLSRSSGRWITSSRSSSRSRGST